MNNDNSIKCGKGKDGYYLRKGECLSTCLTMDKVFYENRICLINQDCRVENCLECGDNNPAVCKRCNNGFFLNDNLCNHSCPLRIRADRISWTCQETPGINVIYLLVFAWYWIFPSKASCSKRCGRIVTEDLDCS